MDFAFRTAPCFNDSGRGAPLGFLKLRHALILAALAIAVGAGCGPSDSGGATKGQSKATDGPSEVDFGFVELNPEQPTPITSYKNGGNMVVYAGEEFRFQVVGDAPLPPIWILGSSGASARLAGGAGMGYSFASHFSPAPAEPAFQAYRRAFVPSPQGAASSQVLC